MIHFLKNNYQWLFSGIGAALLVTILSWIMSSIKKESARWRVVGYDIWSKLRQKRIDLPPKMMTVVDEDGKEESYEVILAFEFKDTKQEYVVYTQNEEDRYGNINVYVSRVDRSGGSPVLKAIPKGVEWNRVREVLKELAESDEKQPLFDEDGIEII